MCASIGESDEDLQPSMLPEEVVDRFIDWYLNKIRMDLQPGTPEMNKYLSEELMRSIENQSMGENLNSVLILLGEAKQTKVLIKEALISGVQSQVIVQINQGIKLRVDLKIERGEWKITNLVKLAKR